MANKRTRRKHIGQEFVSALIHGDLEHARTLVRRSVKGRVDLRDVYLTAFEPANLEVRRLLNLSELTPAEAHIRTMAIQELIEDYSGLVFSASTDGPEALIASLPGELDEIPARSVADLLEIEGFDTSFLSSPRELEEIVSAARSRPFALVVLVVADGSFLEYALSTLQRLRDLDMTVQIILASGAQLGGASPGSIFNDAAEAIEAAKGLLREGRADESV